MRRHYTALVSLALTVAIFFLNFYFALNELSLLRRERTLSSFQKVALLSSLASLDNSDGLQTADYLKSHVSFIGQTFFICDVSGVVTASNDSALMGRNYQALGLPVIKDSSLPPQGVNQVIFLQPVVRQTRFKGYVGLMQNYNNLGAMVVQRNKGVFISSLFLLGLLVLICYRALTRIIFKPVERLQKVVSECGLSDPLLSPDAPVSNELSMLGRAIGQMNCQLKDDRDFQKQQLEALRRANTEVEQAKLALNSAERVALAGRLASSIAHDVGNPLGVVQGYLTMLDGLDGEEQRAVIEKMQRELDRITRAIHSLLDVSRPITLNRSQVKVSPWLAAIVERVGKMPRLAQATIHLIDNLPADFSFSFDEERLTAVMENLLINGADAMKDNFPEREKTLHLRASSVDGGLLLTVTDNGPGLPDDLLEKVFEPFFSTKPSQRGTGLGLYTAKQVVELHHGKISLRNEQNFGLCVAVLLNA